MKYNKKIIVCRFSFSLVENVKKKNNVRMKLVRKRKFKS